MKLPCLKGIVWLQLLWSCKTDTRLSIEQHNDTTLVVHYAISDAISGQYMPGESALRRPYIFNDSILLTSRNIPLHFLPGTVGQQHFKIMPEPDILRMLRADSNNLKQPNYLVISRFEANDTGYYILVENLNALPFTGGGSLGIYYKMKGDTLVNAERLGGSIN